MAKSINFKAADFIGFLTFELLSQNEVGNNGIPVLWRR